VSDRQSFGSTADADSPGPLTVVVDGVEVTYRTRIGGSRSLKRLLVGRHPEESVQEVRALKGVSFTVHEGESVGLVGDNGSGKTTLLRTIAGLLRITEGEILVRSTPVLLGVAAALEPELSGRRNVFLGATALGMSRADIEARFDDIVGFSGIGSAIERPLRTYSSGMMARLRFAIATATTPDILLVDEALAVGDASFKQRSEERMRELLERAGTIFLVSHNLAEVERVCQRAIWLEDGIIRKDGPTDAVLEAYRSSRT
jgi:teichoic acid transport system ATP-binding protein